MRYGADMVEHVGEAVVCRLAPVADTAGVREASRLFRAYAAELPITLDFQGFDDELASLPGAYAPPAGALWLAWSGDWAVGCGGLRPLGAGRAEIKRLYVDPAWRGQGLGRQLAGCLVASARELGYRAVRLDTLAGMAAALRVYRELGFHPIAAYYANPHPGTVYLELDLARGAVPCLPQGGQV